MLYCMNVKTYRNYNKNISLFKRCLWIIKPYLSIFYSAVYLLIISHLS